MKRKNQCGAGMAATLRVRLPAGLLIGIALPLRTTRAIAGSSALPSINQLSGLARRTTSSAPDFVHRA
jgi:hypothetical protein